MSYHFDDFLQRQLDFDLQTPAEVMCSRDTVKMSTVVCIKQSIKKVIFGCIGKHHCTDTSQSDMYIHVGLSFLIKPATLPIVAQNISERGAEYKILTYILNENCNFLLVISSNFGRISYRFRDTDAQS